MAFPGAAYIAKPALLPRAANLNFFVLSTDIDRDGDILSADNNVALSITQSGNNSTLTYAAAAFGTDIIGTWVTLSGFSAPGNNGTFACTARPSGTTLTLTNPAGVNASQNANFGPVHGSVLSVKDRKSLELYTEVTVANQPATLPCVGTPPPWPPSVGTSTKDAFVISRSGTTSRRLTKTGSAIAPTYQGNIASSFAVYFGSRTALAPSGTCDFLMIGTTTNGIRLGMNWGTSTPLLTRYESGVSTAVNLTTSFLPTTPKLLGVTYDPVSGFISPFTYARGASSVTALTPVATGTLRSPPAASMSQMQLMSSLVAGGSGSYVLAWAGAPNVAWGASTYLEIGKWVDTYGYAGLTIPT